MHTHTYTYTYMHIRVQTPYIYACTGARNTDAHTYIYTDTHVHTPIYTCIYTYIHTDTYTHRHADTLWLMMIESTLQVQLWPNSEKIVISCLLNLAIQSLLSWICIISNSFTKQIASILSNNSQLIALCSDFPLHNFISSTICIRKILDLFFNLSHNYPFYL